MYCDDALVYTSSKEEDRKSHLAKVAEIMAVLDAADARVQISKLHIGERQVKFLGMMQSEDGWAI